MPTTLPSIDNMIIHGNDEQTLKEDRNIYLENLDLGDGLRGNLKLRVNPKRQDSRDRMVLRR